jgi:hypothetical protein
MENNNENVHIHDNKENVKIEVNETQPKPLSLNVDILLLNNMKSLLEISTQRGSFKANELSSVGKIYDELLQLLN